MELSAELFVLDNLLMDLLMLRLAAAIGALRLRPVAAVLAAFLGAVYALLSMSALPLLTHARAQAAAVRGRVAPAR